MPSPAFRPLVCVVDFHHARGPEIEHWVGADPGRDPAVDNDWHLIPYMALPDGAHTSAEEFSYFTLVYRGDDIGDGGRDGRWTEGRGTEGRETESRDGEKETEVEQGATSLFGISCTQQIDSAQLLHRPGDVTRSAVQKAVVAITDRPQSFGALREKLSVVTRAWFAQRDFRDLEILQRLQEGLVKESRGPDEERDQYVGLSLRELVHQYKWQTLVLFKCLLLQSKMLFFGSHCEHVCQVQFSLLSLIPGLVRSLGDCAAPELDHYAATVRKQDSVRTSDRASLLAYMGLPLQIFGKGSIFGPYTPLQQLDGLTDEHTTSYVLGSTNSLLLGQKERYCDILVNLDENTATILSPRLKSALALSVADRRWIDFLTQTVNDTWDDADPSRTKSHGYVGSEEFIRLQFEEYLLAMLASSKYTRFMKRQKRDGGSGGGDHPRPLPPDIDGDPAADFAPLFLDAWHRTENHGLWDRVTDAQLFDIVEPRHPCAGGLTIEDVQRRLAAQVAELHLDDRFSQTRDVVGRRLADGRTTVTSAFNRMWADIETMREAQRKRAGEAREGGDAAAAGAGTAAAAHDPPSPAESTQHLQHAQASVQAAGQRAGAYLSSWQSWASEKRKQGWGWKPEGGATTAIDGKVGAREVVGEARPAVTARTELGEEKSTDRAAWSAGRGGGGEQKGVGGLAGGGG